MFLDVIPTDEDGMICLSPAGLADGEPIDGVVDKEWFRNSFPDLATAPVPLSQGLFDELCAIDSFWSQNAQKWRAEGLI